MINVSTDFDTAYPKSSNLGYDYDIKKLIQHSMLLLLSDDYVVSSNEDARKGGVVALAA